MRPQEPQFCLRQELVISEEVRLVISEEVSVVKTAFLLAGETTGLSRRSRGFCGAACIKAHYNMTKQKGIAVKYIVA